MYYMVGVTPSDVSLRNLIARDPVRAQESAKNQFKTNQSTINSSFFNLFRKDLGVEHPHEYYKYLSDELIPRVLPELLKYSVDHLPLVWHMQKNNFNEFMNLVAYYLHDLLPNFSVDLNRFISHSSQTINPNEKSQVDSFINLMEQTQVLIGLKTAIDTLIKFLKLIPKKLKEAKPNEKITLEAIFETLKSKVTKGTIWKMMKTLEIGEFLSLDAHISEVHGYNSEFFILSGNDLSFQPKKIDMNQKEPIEGVHSTGPYMAKKSQNDSTRLGCPASSEELDMVIEHLEKILRLMWDSKCDDLLQAV